MEKNLTTDIWQHIVALLESVVGAQNPEFGGGMMSAAAYDTAWVAMVRDPKDPHRLAFPRSLEWLERHQAADGSWSGPFPHTLLPTLAGLLALDKAPVQTEAIRSAAARANAYLREALPQWSVGSHESVGFEVLAPGILRELEQAGRAFEFPGKEQLLKLYAEKLLIAGPELIYTGESNLIHSLEAFGPALDFTRLKQRQAPNGAYGCSPAATAAVLMFSHEWDHAAARWLTQLSEQAFDGEVGAMPNAYPIDAFEGAWVLYNLAHAGLDLGRHCPASLLQRLRTWLMDCLTAQGASITRFLGMPTDSDDTGMVLAALNLTGPTVPPTSISHFERDGYFLCFTRERGPSVSANAHVLAALSTLPEPDKATWAGSIAKTIDFLFSVRNKDGYWEDKWHASAYYATACVVTAMAGTQSAAVRDKLAVTAEWLLQTHRSDGGWGSTNSANLEETAYALQALRSLPDVVSTTHGEHYRAVIAKGEEYLRAHLGDCLSDHGVRLPKLWRGKELYTPANVVASAVLAMLACSEGSGDS